MFCSIFYVRNPVLRRRIIDMYSEICLVARGVEQPPMPHVVSRTHWSSTSKRRKIHDPAPLGPPDHQRKQQITKYLSTRTVHRGKQKAQKTEPWRASDNPQAPRTDTSVRGSEMTNMSLAGSIRRGPSGRVGNTTTDFASHITAATDLSKVFTSPHSISRLINRSKLLGNLRSEYSIGNEFQLKQV